MNDRNYGYGDNLGGDGASGDNGGHGGYGGHGGTGGPGDNSGGEAWHGGGPGIGPGGYGGPGDSNSRANGGPNPYANPNAGYGGPHGPQGTGPGGPNALGGPPGPYGAGPGAYEGPPSSDPGAGAGAGAGGGTGDGGNNKGILIGIGALVAVVVLALGAFMFLGGDDETEGAVTETTASDEEAGGEGADGGEPTTAADDETTSTTASEAPATEADSGSSEGDGSMTAPYADVVPAYVRDNAEGCREAVATITSFDTGVGDRTVPGMRCRGADGSLLEGNNIELIDDDEFAKAATDQARTMEYEVIKEEGGVTLIAAAYSGGSSKIYWADENEGISLEMYPYDNLEEAKTAAGQMK